MLLSLQSLLLGVATLTSVVTAQVDSQLTGTWTTKSRKVFTGPVRSCPCHKLWRPHKEGNITLTPEAALSREPVWRLTLSLGVL